MTEQVGVKMKCRNCDEEATYTCEGLHDAGSTAHYCNGHALECCAMDNPGTAACPAVVNIGGINYRCDSPEVPHAFAHTNRRAGAIWLGADERISNG